MSSVGAVEGCEEDFTGKQLRSLRQLLRDIEKKGLLSAFDLDQSAVYEAQGAVRAVLRSVDPMLDRHSAVSGLAVLLEGGRGDLALGRRAAFAQHLHSQVTLINQRAVAAH